MGVRAKLIVIIAFVALVPLAVSAFSALRVHQTAFDDKVEELQRNSADLGAALFSQSLDSALASLTSIASPIPWSGLSDEERAGALLLVYRQLPDVAVVQLTDGDGQGIGDAVYREQLDELTAHPMGSIEILRAFSKHLFVATDRSSVGDVFRAEGAKAPFLAMAVPLGSNLNLAIAFSMRAACQKLRELTPDSLDVLLVSRGGRLVCAAAGSTELPVAPKAIADARGPASVNYTNDGQELLASLSLAGSFRVVTQQPSKAAGAASKRMRYQTLFWLALSLLIAVACGWFLSREISRPIEMLTVGATELAEGKLDYRLEFDSADEFGRLARTFNFMGSEIEKRDAEIREWNVELQERVDQKTRDLKDAQEQLLQSQKLAAVSSLASGVAHEVNNPLTAVIGLTQVVKRRVAKREDVAKELKALDSIEREAQRIGEIIQTLRDLSAEAEGEGFVSTDVARLISEIVDLIADRVEAAGLTLTLDLAADLPEVRANPQKLTQVFVELLGNAITASKPEQSIKVALDDVDGKMVRVMITDHGKGIEPANLDRVFEPFFTTKDNWQGRGLGLTVAHQIVTEHHGTIRIESAEGVGTTVALLFPIARAESQLE